MLYNPAFVATGLHEPFGQPLRALVRMASAVFAQPVAKAVPPIAALLDHPPAAPLMAWKKGKIIDLAVDRNEARRVEEAIRPMAQSAFPWSPDPGPPWKLWRGASGGSGFEEFDEVSGWVGQEDLVSAGTGDDVAAEGQSGGA